MSADGSYDVASYYLEWPSRADDYEGATWWHLELCSGHLRVAAVHNSGNQQIRLGRHILLHTCVFAFAVGIFCS